MSQYAHSPPSPTPAPAQEAYHPYGSRPQAHAAYQPVPHPATEKPSKDWQPWDEPTQAAAAPTPYMPPHAPQPARYNPKGSMGGEAPRPIARPESKVTPPPLWQQEHPLPWQETQNDNLPNSTHYAPISSLERQDASRDDYGSKVRPMNTTRSLIEVLCPLTENYKGALSLFRRKSQFACSRI